jgi:hypothetical protein
MTPVGFTLRILYVTALTAAVSSSGLAADDKKPARSQPTPSVKRMNEAAAAQGPPAPKPAPAPAPSTPTPAVKRMGPAGTAGGTVPPPGWEQMTPVEREQYQRDLRDTKSAEECRILNSRTQQQMTQRARERGEPLPPSRGVDLCAR